MERFTKYPGCLPFAELPEGHALIIGVPDVVYLPPEFGPDAGREVRVLRSFMAKLPHAAATTRHLELDFEPPGKPGKHLFVAESPGTRQFIWYAASYVPGTY